MPHDVALISMLAIRFGLALPLGFLAHRLGLPPLVGYLAAGVVVGPSTPGFVGDAALAGQLAEVGVMLLMFGVGLHFSVADLLAVCGPDRELTVARELTKRFEEIATVRLGEAAAWLAADAHREQGEFVLIVHAEVQEAPDDEADPAHDVLLDALLESLSVRDAARVAAKVTGQPRDVLYNRALSRKKAQD